MKNPTLFNTGTAFVVVFLIGFFTGGIITILLVHAMRS